MTLIVVNACSSSDGGASYQDLLFTSNSDSLSSQKRSDVIFLLGLKEMLKFSLHTSIQGIVDAALNSQQISV